MTTIAIILGITSIVNFVFLYLVYKQGNKQKPNQVLPQPQMQPINIDLNSVHEAINKVPNKVLNSITSSSNTHKGALGELIGYMNLRSSYNRIIPLGNIVDFICIKFSDEEQPGSVDFIDIKTGDKSKLSKDQRELQKLIDEKRINFIKYKVENVTGENPPK